MTKNQTEEATGSWYEDVSFTFLKRNMPAVIRISGQQYHDFVRKFQKPYDPVFLGSMQETLRYLCDTIPGCVFGYTQSFTFILVLQTPAHIETTSWFSSDIQKIASVSASMATLKFNKIFEKNAKSYVMTGNHFDETKQLNAMQGYVGAIDKGALFLANCFNIPAEDLFHYLYLQQKQSIESAVLETGAAYFTEKELAGKSAAQIQFMYFDKTGKNFDDFPAEFKRGAACIQDEEEWIVDREMPMLREENRDYIQRFL